MAAALWYPVRLGAGLATEERIARGMWNPIECFLRSTYLCPCGREDVRISNPYEPEDYYYLYTGTGGWDLRISSPDLG
jgi:hypothetical protein